MTHTVNSFIRRRGTSPDEPVELYYTASGKHLQEDARTLAEHHLPKPDLLHGLLRCVSLAQAAQIATLKLNGLFTRAVELEDADNFYAEHPEFIGPPRIQLKAPRPPRAGGAPAAKGKG